MFDYKEASRPLHSGAEVKAGSLANVEDDVQFLEVTKKTLMLDRLPELQHLRYLSAYDLDELHFQRICAATQITHLTANINSIRDIRCLQNLVNLQILILTDNNKITSLAGLEALAKLRALVLSNCPVSLSLAPLAGCKELRFLWLRNSHVKPMRLDSLSPLSGLSKLERIKFSTVRVEDRSLVPLHKLANLVEIELPNYFSHKEFLALGQALPNAHGNWLDLHREGKHEMNRKPKKTSEPSEKED